MSYRSNGDAYKYDRHSTMNRQQTQNSVLYVTNFSREMGKKKFQSLFCPFGRVKDICIFSSPKIAAPYAFVQYDDLRDAVQAKNKLNGSLAQGFILKVEYKKAKPVSRHVPYNQHQYYLQHPKIFSSGQNQSPLAQSLNFQQQHYQPHGNKNIYKNEDGLQKSIYTNSRIIQNSSQYSEPPIQYGNYPIQPQNVYNNQIKLNNTANPYFMEPNKTNQNKNPQVIEEPQEKNIEVKSSSQQQANANKQRPIIQTNITQNTIVGANNQNTTIATTTNTHQPQKNQIQIVMNKPINQLNSYDYKLQNDRQSRIRRKHRNRHNSSSSSPYSSSNYSSNQQPQKYHKRKFYDNQNQRSQQSRRERQTNINNRNKKHGARSRERDIYKHNKRSRSRAKYDRYDKYNKYDKRKNDTQVYQRDEKYRQFQKHQFKPNRQYNQQINNILQNKPKLSQHQKLQDKVFNSSNSSNLNRESTGNSYWMDKKNKECQNHFSIPAPNQNLLNIDPNNFNFSTIQIPAQPNPWQLQSQIVSLCKLVQRQTFRINELQNKLDNLIGQNRINQQNSAQNLKETQNLNKDFEKTPR